MREYVTGLRQALSADVGDAVQFAYQGAAISWSPAIPLAQERVPVLMAAMYPAMRQLSGSVADGIALGSLHSAAFTGQPFRISPQYSSCFSRG